MPPQYDSEGLAPFRLDLVGDCIGSIRLHSLSSIIVTSDRDLLLITHFK